MAWRALDPLTPGRQVVVRYRVARPDRPAGLVPRRVGGEDQDVAGIRGGKTAAGGCADRSPARIVHRAIEHARNRRAGDFHHHNARLGPTPEVVKCAVTLVTAAELAM